MTLRRKTLLLIGVCAVAAVAILYASSQLILLKSFVELETQDAREHLYRIENSLNDELDYMASTAADWAYWDDTYQFIQDRNEDYIANNLVDDSLVNLSFDMVLYLDNANQIVYGKAVNLQSGEDVPLPIGLDAFLSADGPLVQHADDTSKVTGLIQLPSGVIMVAARPILTSLNAGPIEGTFVWGRYLSPDKIAQLSSTLGLTLSIARYNDPNVPADFKQAADSFGTQSTFVQPLNEENLAAYLRLDDLYGQPAIILRATMPRQIYAEGKATLTYFYLSLVVIALVVSGAIVLYLDRTVLSRLARLSALATDIQTTGDLSVRAPVTGTDEVANLGHGLNSMLDSLAGVRQRLQETNDELEQRVVERTAELASARDQALEALRLKTQIVANVSHDARTPLNVITLRTEMLQRGRYGPTTDHQRTALERIMESAQQLIAFFGNLLTEAQLDKQAMKLAKTEFAPLKLLDSVGEAMRPLAERKNLVLTTHAGANIPPIMLGDVVRLQQILVNLTENAIKFTNEGGVDIGISRADESHWEMCVADTGTGIAADVQELIFEAFWQVDGSATRKNNRGVGLGLSIVKQLTTLMGGEIVVESVVGNGTVFKVTLPLLVQMEQKVAEGTGM